jgi:hypothetical protein
MSAPAPRIQPAIGSEAGPDADAGPGAAPHRRPTLRIALAWTVVGVPLLYGIGQTVVKASQLFG